MVNGNKSSKYIHLSINPLTQIYPCDKKQYINIWMHIPTHTHRHTHTHTHTQTPHTKISTYHRYQSIKNQEYRYKAMKKMQIGKEKVLTFDKI